MPPSLRKAFGIGLADFTRPATYLATNFVFVTLTAALFAACLGASLIAKEEVLHTAELLYAQPVSRTRILGGKAGALAIYALAYPAALGAIAIAVLAAVVQRPLEPALLVELFAGAAAIARVLRRRRHARRGPGPRQARRRRRGAGRGPRQLPARRGLGDLGTGGAAALAVAVPRGRARRGIVARGGLDPVRAAALVVAGVAFAALAIARYRRQDLHA